MNLGGPISAEPRINDRIRVPEVRLDRFEHGVSDVCDDRVCHADVFSM
jgi:hypothetical protein